MKIIDLDAGKWEKAEDLYTALLPAIEAPVWHGSNIAAVIDSVIWHSFNGLKPPYVISVFNTKGKPSLVLEQIMFLQAALERARKEHISRKGNDIDVRMEVKE